MYISAPQKRIMGAIFVATAIVSGALLLRPTGDAPVTVINGETIVVTEAPKRTAIEIADSNGDGVPDWQEALQETEPIAVPTTEAIQYDPPKTLTNQFALEFFEAMMRNEGAAEFGRRPEELVSSASAAVARQATDRLYTESDIIIDPDSSKQNLEQYGITIANIITAYSETDQEIENETQILERALRDQNEAELKKLDGKVAAYRKYIEETKRTPVPERMVIEHLHLLNSYQAMENDILAMQLAFTDPMLTFLRIKRYQEDATGLYNSIVTLYTKLLQNGAEWPADSVVYDVIGITNQQ